MSSKLIGSSPMSSEKAARPCCCCMGAGRPGTPGARRRNGSQTRAGPPTHSTSAACIRGTRQVLTRAQVGSLRLPVLIAVGTRDQVAGSAHDLAALIPGAKALDIANRDHMLAVGDRIFKAGVLAFLQERP